MSNEGNRYFALHGVGGHIWELLAQPHSMSELVNSILANYEIDESQARQDVNEFLESLESRKLISAQ